jgi:hypothetical protein
MVCSPPSPKARGWIEELRLGCAATLAEITECEGFGERHDRVLGPLAFVAPRVIAATVDGSVAGYGTVTGLPQRLPDPCDEQEKAKSVVPRLRGADAVSAAPAILKDLRFSGYQRAIGIYSHLKLMSLSWNNRRDSWLN